MTIDERIQTETIVLATWTTMTTPIIGPAVVLRISSKQKKGCLKPATPQNKGKFIRQFTYLYGILTLVEKAINLPVHIATSEFHFRN